MTALQKKIEKAISKGLAPLYKDNPTLQTFTFLVHFWKDQDEILLADEDFYINGKRWDDYGSEELDALNRKLSDIIAFATNEHRCEIVKEYGEALGDIRAGVLSHFRVSCEPLNKIWETEWDIISTKLVKKIGKDMKEAYPWKYIDYLEVKTKRDGSVKVEEEGKRR